MKFLFDENISHRILKKLNSEFANSIHCKNINPNPKNDLDIWNYAKSNDFTIVTFDEDFYEWMILKGFPPKIIWLRTGNTTTNNIAEIINKKSLDIKDFHESKEVGIFELY
ncbi:MAG TPA: DUF5615 family PIN-like protein [Ignavibacteria bacterium]|nr:DUF5615 family PIN-like protein [Ignavibacteria bacterium]